MWIAALLPPQSATGLCSPENRNKTAVSCLINLLEFCQYINRWMQISGNSWKFPSFQGIVYKKYRLNRFIYVHDHISLGCRQKRQRSVEHFRQQLDCPHIFFIPVKLPDDLEQHDELEIISVAQIMINKKWTSDDGISPEIFKFCLSALLSPPTKLFCLIWDPETFLKNWTQYIKKGWQNNACRLHRNTSITDIAAKLFAIFMLNCFVCCPGCTTILSSRVSLHWPVLHITLNLRTAIHVSATHHNVFHRVPCNTWLRWQRVTKEHTSDRFFFDSLCGYLLVGSRTPDCAC